MTSKDDRDMVIGELNGLKQRLDDSLAGLAERAEHHRPMHEIVGLLIDRIARQQDEIQMLKDELARSRRDRH